MTTIKVCVGSSCHLKGAYEVVQILKELVSENKLDVDIDLGATFCQGKCNKAVIIQFDDQVITNVSPDNIRKFFYQELEWRG